MVLFSFLSERVGESISGTGDKKVVTQTFLSGQEKSESNRPEERSERQQEQAMQHVRAATVSSEQREGGHSKDHLECWTRMSAGGQALNGSEDGGWGGE